METTTVAVGHSPFFLASGKVFLTVSSTTSAVRSGLLLQKYDKQKLRFLFFKNSSFCLSHIKNRRRQRTGPVLLRGLRNWFRKPPLKYHDRRSESTAPGGRYRRFSHACILCSGPIIRSWRYQSGLWTATRCLRPLQTSFRKGIVRENHYEGRHPLSGKEQRLDPLRPKNRLTIQEASRL